jgi:hypothetical protein
VRGWLLCPEHRLPASLRPRRPYASGRAPTRPLARAPLLRPLRPPRPPRPQALAAQAVKVEPQVAVIPEIKVDLYGAVSAVSAGEEAQEGVFQ